MAPSKHVSNNDKTANIHRITIDQFDVQAIKSSLTYSVQIT